MINKLINCTNVMYTIETKGAYSVLEVPKSGIQALILHLLSIDCRTA